MGFDAILFAIRCTLDGLLDFFSTSGLESLLRCCLHFAHIRADEVLAKAMQTISLLLTK